MNCLCCGKPLGPTEERSGWHKRCVLRFFGTTVLPQIDIDDTVLDRLAQESTVRGLTVPGVQKKLSLHLKAGGGTPRLTLVNYPTGYILKPQVEAFTALPEAEQLVMSMAEIAGIATVPHGLIRGREGYAYITRRVDRVPGKDGPAILAMEDFCQLDLRLTADKYHGSYERCAKVIGRYSSRPGLDSAELFLRVLFSFAVGNSDMHLKNFSLLETAEGSETYVLSPAYDLLPVNLVMPEDTEEFALTLNGKKRNLHRKDFLCFAGTCGLARQTAERLIERVRSLEPVLTKMCAASLLPPDMKERFAALIRGRCGRL